LHGGQREPGIPEPHEPGHIRERLKEVRATNARAKKSGPLTPPCPNHPRWRCGVLPKQEARGSRCPRRCRGRARGQGRTGRTQRRSQLKARWPVDRDKTLSRFCPAWKSKNFVSRARNTPLRSVFLAAWKAKVSWSCSARPASLGFPERSGVLPAPEIPGSVSKPKGTPRKYQSGPSSWAATASGEGGDSNGSCQRGGDYRCAVRGGDLDLLPVAGMPPNTGGVPTAANRVGTAAQDRFWKQSPVGQFVELGKAKVASRHSVSAPLGVHMKGGIRFMGSAQFPTTWRLVEAKAKRHRVG